MDVEGEFTFRFERGHQARADGDIGNEMAIHDVDMDIIRTSIGNGAYFLAQTREIGGKNRWRNSNISLHAA